MAEIQKILEESDVEEASSDDDLGPKEASDEDESSDGSDQEDSSKAGALPGSPVCMADDDSSDGDDSNSEWRAVTGKTLHQFPFTGQGKLTNISDTSPYGIFSLFLNDEVLNLIVEETNKKAHSTIGQWNDTTVHEIKKFLGLIIYFGLVQYPSYRLYWSKDRKFANSFVRQTMTRNRFSLLLRFVHFSDESLYPGDRLKKVAGLINLLNTKFSEVKTPGEDVVIDETMIPFRGRLLFRQYMPGKSAKYGIKLFKICDPEGYTYKLSVYAGKNDPNDKNSLRHSDKVVMNLMEKYLREGRTLVVDNFYTNFELAKNMLKLNTHLVGTLRKFIKGVPKEYLNPGKSLKKGGVVGKENNGVVVAVWKDKRDVRILSTRHSLQMVSTGKKLKNGDIQTKPESILYYNARKQGVDLSDQMSSYFTPLKKTIRWFHKVGFFVLLGTAIVNSAIVYKKLNSKKIQIAEFRTSVVDALIGDENNNQIQANVHVLEKNNVKNERNRTVRGRCSTCYHKLKVNIGRQLALRKAASCATRCITCPKQPFMCLPCFTEHIAAPRR